MKHFFISLTFFCLLPYAVHGIEFHVDRSRENLVRFISETPLEDFHVKTKNIDGYVYWEGDKFPPKEPQLETSDIYYEVQLNSLDAGNSMYNRHMKENYLETDKYPYASYKARIIRIDRVHDSLFNIHISGSFSVHGRSNPLDIIGLAKPVGDGFNVKCDFIVKLSDYEIDLPKLMFIKADELINVYLDFYVKPVH